MNGGGQMQISLKSARVNKGLTQKESAEALGVDKKTVGSWENGRTMPKCDMIEAICALYDVRYDDIKWKS
jgi:putative transcriptional regulator